MGMYMLPSNVQGSYYLPVVDFTVWNARETWGKVDNVLMLYSKKYFMSSRTTNLSWWVVYRPVECCVVCNNIAVELWDQILRFPLMFLKISYVLVPTDWFMCSNAMVVQNHDHTHRGCRWWNFTNQFLVSGTSCSYTRPLILVVMWLFRHTFIKLTESGQIFVIFSNIIDVKNCIVGEWRTWC